VAQATTDSATRRQLLEQKVALLANYLESVMTKRIADGNNTAAKALVQSAEDLLEQARRAIDAGNHARADHDLNEALRNLSGASQIAARDRRVESDAQARARYKRLRRHIDSYLKPSGKMASSSGEETRWRKAKSHVAALMDEAEELATAGHHRNANKLLAEAYRTVVSIIAESRRGETVVSPLRFLGPKDEFDYERRRNDSFEMLVELLLSEPRKATEGDLREVVGRFATKSRTLRRQADDAAVVGDYQTAIGIMEEATRHLTRALQAGGLPVSE
jgi:HPt (histidine-containing phosphotransfer) domain-containing protein